MNGNHDIQQCFAATEETLHHVYGALFDARIVLEATLLKVNMVLAGTDCERQANSVEIAELTLKSLRRSVPAAVPGIVFLSGGQTPKQATKRLNVINVHADNVPWRLSFSYGRALQDNALRIWNGRSENTQIAQKALGSWAKLNGQATLACYEESTLEE